MINKLFLIIITLFSINKNLYAKEIISKNKLLNNNNIYLGGKIGISNFINTKNLSNNFKIIDTKIENNKIGFGNFLGYKINKIFNFEIGYENLGKILKKGKFINGFFKTKGITISNKINFNILNNIKLYTKIGWIILKSTSKKINIINNTKNYISYKKISPLTSLGIEYKINNNLYTRLDYQFIYNLGQKNIFHEEPNNNLFNINLIYKLNNFSFNKIKNIFKNKINLKNNNNKNIDIKDIKLNINYLNNIFNIIKLKNFNIKYILIKDFRNNKNILISNKDDINIKNVIKNLLNKDYKIIDRIEFIYNLNNYKKIKCKKFNKLNNYYNNCLSYLNNKIFIRIYIDNI